jgi:hypothetical protein
MNTIEQLGRIAAREIIKQAGITDEALIKAAEGRGFGNLRGAWEALANSRVGKFFGGGPPSKPPTISPTAQSTLKARSAFPDTYTSSSGDLSPDLKRLADKMDIPHDEYLNTLRGHLPGSILPSSQRMKMPAATPDKIRSALLGTAATIGTVGGLSMVPDTRPQTDTANDAAPKVLTEIDKAVRNHAGLKATKDVPSIPDPTITGGK